MYESLKKLDLSLLIALDMLLREKHVSRAADKLDLSQPGMSRALARLRELFGDPLLVRGRSGMMLTERAEALAPEVQMFLDQAQRLFDAGGFDAAQSTRKFSIRATHYAMQTYLPEIVRSFRRQAPNASLVIEDLKVHDLEMEVSPSCDLAIAGPDIIQPETYIRRKLGEDRFVCIMSADHPLADKELTLDDYLAYPQCVVSMGGGPSTKVDEALAQVGKRRRAALFLPNSLAALEMMRGSDFLITAACNQVRRFAEQFGLIWKDLPFPHMPVTYHLVWHPLYQDNLAHRWFRTLVQDHMQKALLGAV